jgi:transcriptional regulator with XRE-family HTH domain
MYLSERLKTLRERMGFSQKRLGRQLGVTDAFVCQLEQGKRSPARSYYRRLSRFVAATDGLTDPEPLYEELLILDMRQRDPELFATLCAHYPVAKVHKSVENNRSRVRSSKPRRQKSLFRILAGEVTDETGLS